MPLFEYRCMSCEKDFELLVRRSEEPQCPECGADSLEKLLSAAAAPVMNGHASLPLAPSCPPGNQPCSPTCCRLP
jgi:putative FmdB family regulatory protein